MILTVQYNNTNVRNLNSIKGDASYITQQKDTTTLQNYFCIFTYVMACVFHAILKYKFLHFIYHVFYSCSWNKSFNLVNVMLMQLNWN